MIPNLNWEVTAAGDTLMQEIEALAKKVGVSASKRRDIDWLLNNLRKERIKGEKADDVKTLLTYVQLAHMQGHHNENA